MTLAVGASREAQFLASFGEEIDDVVLINPRLFQGRIRYELYIPAGGTRGAVQTLLSTEIAVLFPHTGFSLRSLILASPREIEVPLWHRITNLHSADADVDQLEISIRLRRGR